MKQLISIMTLLLLQLGAAAQYRPHPVSINGISDTVTASLNKKHHVYYYRLTIRRPGFPDRVMTLGALTDDNSRAVILKDLKDSLHKAFLFPPVAPAGFDPTDQAIDVLINDLIMEAFPYTNVYASVPEVVINDNNKLRLLYQLSDHIYQLSLITPGARLSLLHYNADAGALQYEFDWPNVANTVILDNFDQLMGLYFKLPSTLVTPSLYLIPQPLTSDYELRYSYDSHTLNSVPGRGIIMPKEMVKKLAVQTVYMTSRAGAGTTATVLKIIDPASPEAAKKPKDDPQFEEQQ